MLLVGKYKRSLFQNVLTFQHAKYGNYSNAWNAPKESAYIACLRIRNSARPMTFCYCAPKRQLRLNKNHLSNAHSFGPNYKQAQRRYHTLKQAMTISPVSVEVGAVVAAVSQNQRRNRATNGARLYCTWS